MNPAPKIAADTSVSGNDRKRRRKVTTCLECRRRKLQCDRAQPICGRCAKFGDKCVYGDDVAEQNEDPNDETASSATRVPVAAYPGSLFSEMEFLAHRIKKLELSLHQFGQDTPQSIQTETPGLSADSRQIEFNDTTSRHASDRDNLLLRGSSFATQFWGNSCPGALIGFLPELSAFTKETLERFPSLARVQQDLHVLEERTVYADSRNQHGLVTDADLRALLPPKLETDALVQLYLSNFDSIYHVIHLPTFQQQYKEMWTEAPNNQPQVIALVLMMTAVAGCLTFGSTGTWLYRANSSIAREKALATVEVCSNWIQAQSQKRVAAVDFQIRFLIILARWITLSKPKRAWLEASSFLKFCMAAGLHRDPDLLRKPTSPLDKEMRRRVWTAAVEFELQAAFSRGMSSAPWTNQSDCTVPTNIDDSAIDQSSHMPPPKPNEEFTNISYLIAATRSFTLRHRLNSLINSVHHVISFDEAKRLTEEIDFHVQSIPSWTTEAGSSPRAFLHVTLWQYLLVIYSRQIVRSGSLRREREYCKMVLTDTSMKILDAHKALVEKGNHVLQLLCHDHVRIALSICQVALLGSGSSNNIISAASTLVEVTANKLLSDIIELVMEQLARLGRDQRQLWTALAVNALIKAKRDPSRRLEYMQEAVDKVSRAYYKIMAYQSEELLGNVTLKSEKRSSGPNGPIGTPRLGPVEQPTNGDLEDAAVPQLMDMWTFEDWMFNPEDTQVPQFEDSFPQF